MRYSLTPRNHFLQGYDSTALADCRSLELLNEELVKKQRKNRVKKNNKAFTGARVLCMRDMIKQAEERRKRNKRRRRRRPGKKHLEELLALQSRFGGRCLWDLMFSGRLEL